MATYVLSTAGAFDAAAAASNVVPVNNGGVYKSTSGVADTITAPKIAAGDSIAADFKCQVIRVGAGAKTIAVDASNTLVGITTLDLAGEGATLVRTGDTQWTAQLNPVAHVDS